MAERRAVDRAMGKQSRDTAMMPSLTTGMLEPNIIKSFLISELNDP